MSTRAAFSSFQTGYHHEVHSIYQSTHNNLYRHKPSGSLVEFLRHYIEYLCLYMRSIGCCVMSCPNSSVIGVCIQHQESTVSCEHLEHLSVVFPERWKQNALISLIGLSYSMISLVLLNRHKCDHGIYANSPFKAVSGGNITTPAFRIHPSLI